jgi:hypothetical protein
MDPYSGLVDLFEAKGILKKDGNRLKYTDLTGKDHIDYRKAWTGEKLDMIMSDITNKPEIVENLVDEDVVVEETVTGE